MTDGIICYVTDVGSWKMFITDIDGNVYGNGIDITKYIRDTLPIDDVFVFDRLG